MPDITASLTEKEMELLEAFAKLHGVQPEEALKRACKTNLKTKFKQNNSEIRLFKRPEGGIK